MITYKACSTFDGGYIRSGELPPGTEHVQIKVADSRPFGRYSLARAECIIEEAFKDRLTRNPVYYILPLATKSKPKKEVPNEME